MPQHDLILDNASGAGFRADANGALAALGSCMKGPNAPPAPLAGMIWVDDDTPSATIWTIKQYDGAEWIELGRLDITANIYIPSEGVIAWVDVASAATVDLSAQASRSLRLTGTATISSFGTATSGVRKRLRIAGGLTITHNATSLICPGAASLFLGAGDIVDVESLGSGNWVVAAVQPASGWRGSSVVLAELIANNHATLDVTTGLDNTYDRYELELIDLKPATNDVTAGLRVGTGVGPAWQSGGSAYASSILGIAATATALLGNTAGSFIPLSQAAGSNNGVISSAGYPGLRGLIRFYNPESADRWNCNLSVEHFAGSGAFVSATGGGYYGSASAITGLRFFFSTGNISSGSIRLLGYRR
jgi:hypothetical protein